MPSVLLVAKGKRDTCVVAIYHIRLLLLAILHRRCPVLYEMRGICGRNPDVADTRASYANVRAAA